MKLYFHLPIILLFLSLNSCALTEFYFSSDSYLKDHKDAHWQAIIVPGYPYEGEEWNLIMESRVRWAAFLYQKGFTDYIIFSGAAVYTPYIESRIMKLYAEKLGVPAEHILTEEKAMHSVENLYYSFVMARNRGFTKIALATDPVQYRMLLTVNNNTYGLPIGYASVEPGILNDVSTMEVSIDSSSAFVENFKSIKELRTDKQRSFGNKGGYIVYDPNYLPKYTVKYPSESLINIRKNSINKPQ